MGDNVSMLHGSFPTVNQHHNHRTNLKRHNNRRYTWTSKAIHEDFLHRQTATRGTSIVVKNSFHVEEASRIVYEKRNAKALSTLLTTSPISSSQFTHPTPIRPTFQASWKKKIFSTQGSPNRFRDGHNASPNLWVISLLANEKELTKIYFSMLCSSKADSRKDTSSCNCTRKSVPNSKCT